MTILSRILEDREKRIRISGHTQGFSVPQERQVPVVPFGRYPFLICEIKRKSPSKGKIAPALDAEAQARLYASKGIRSVSVLTEEDYFGGSLLDLMKVKEKLPDLSVLRKDFLLDEEDIHVSFRAGADAVLLIASVLDKDLLNRMHNLARHLGMAALVEVHSREEVEKVSDLKPELVGINSRDLKTFNVDPCHPLIVRSAVSWEPELVFESGITSKEDTVFALSSGFSGILVGETVVRKPERIGEIKAGFTVSRPVRFWKDLYAGKKIGRPLVKVCGLTREEDVKLADDLGADILGFILAPSPRRTGLEFIRSLGKTRALKAGVVVLERGALLPEEIAGLIGDGHIDVVQFHGNEDPGACFSMAFPYYKALRIAGEESTDYIDEYRCPRVLVDAYAAERYGGTGRGIDESLVIMSAQRKPLWLAGGLRPDNIRETIKKYQPELVDASSGLESGPGIKNRDKMKQFFREIAYGSA